MISAAIKSLFRTTRPVSRTFGFDRGVPIDRYYIEFFLNKNRKYIAGSVLEIADSVYSKQFGTGVLEYNVLHAQETEGATIVGDLSDKNTLPANQVDCFICTQTLNVIYDFKAAIEGAHHLLKPGGVLLVTVAGLCQVSRYDMDRWGDYWRFTDLSIKKSFSEVFGEKNVEIETYGNCLAACSILKGRASHELLRKELDYRDKDYQIVISVVAKKEQ